MNGPSPPKGPPNRSPEKRAPVRATAKRNVAKRNVAERAVGATPGRAPAARDAPPARPWLTPQGSPYLLLPRDALAAWRGTYVACDAADAELTTPSGAFRLHCDYDPARPLTDYERAWLFGALAAPLEVGGYAALVVQSESRPLTWLAAGGGGLLALLHCLEPDADAEAALARATDGVAWSPTGHRLPGGEYVVFNALEHGESVSESLPISLADDVSVDTATSRAAGATLWLVRLTPAG
jgi:hypothetical protein